MKKVIIFAIFAVFLNGCTGLVTGHEYTEKEVERVWNTGKAVGAIALPEDVKEAAKPIVDGVESAYEVAKPKK